MFHLPELPNVGYATTREKALSDAIQDFMRAVERDRVRLLTIVLEGRERWRKVAGDLWRGLRIGEDHQALDAIYAYFELQACQPHVQRELLANQKNAAKWRDLMTDARADIEAERDALVRLGERKLWMPQ